MFRNRWKGESNVYDLKQKCSIFETDTFAVFYFFILLVELYSWQILSFFPSFSYSIWYVKNRLESPLKVCIEQHAYLSIFFFPNTRLLLTEGSFLHHFLIWLDVLLYRTSGASEFVIMFLKCA